jgi:hypothetical protein
MNTKEKIATLEEQIKEYSTVVSSNSYSMSVGELASMYKDGELNLHPEFQRFFRWNDEQKSRFIESLLLGIPIPPIFVAQRDDGKWDVIDGLQRLSTIFELMGELLNDKGEKLEPLKLTKTKYLEALEDKIWENKDNLENELPTSTRIEIKRARFDVNIVKSSSSTMAKYEIFQRLNTGGSLATPQEVRNCVLLMTSESFFNWFKELGKYPNFQGCLVLTDRKEDEAFDLELLTRFIVMVNSEISKLQAIDELDSFLTDEIHRIASKNDFDKTSLQTAFEQTFDFLNETLGEDSLKKFNVSKNKYSGPILMPLFEIIAVGLGYRLLHGHKLPDPTSFKEKHKSILSDPTLNRALNISDSGRGSNSRTRIPNTVKYGRQWFEQW